jgi:predicted dehydrogenase
MLVGLQAIVIGSGWAGEGHTLALRAAGVEVVALCGRSPEPAQALARKLGIPHVSLDWRNALSEFSPHIATIATPGAPHRDMAVGAASEGCHVFCDKPLATGAEEARAMLSAVRAAGVKHAYGPASCLAPAISHARSLVENGLLGMLTGVESAHHLGWARPLPYSWLSQTSQGGGALNNLFTHKLAQVIYATGGTPTHVAGDARCFVTRAPVGPLIHDFRDLFRPGPDIDDEATSWRQADADTDYSVILQLSLPTGGEVTARLHGSITSKSRNDATLALYGTKGTLVLTGSNSPSDLHHYDFDRDSWDLLAIPRNADDVDPPVEDAVQRDWNTLIRRFAADIRGEVQSTYPTFEDGWLAAEIIDLVRAGQARAALPRSAPQAM